jgi:hypothetical protein
LRPSIGLSNRIYRAWKHLESEQGGEVKQATLGDMVAAELGLPKPIRQPSVAEWMKKGVRDVDTLWGIARACGVREEWLAFGTAPMLGMKRRDAPPELEERPHPRIPFEPEETTSAAETTRGAGGERGMKQQPATRRRPGSR